MIDAEKAALMHRWAQSSGHICIVCHARPDGDALGSCAAAYHYFTLCEGKRSTVLLPDAPAPCLSFLLDGVHYTADIAEAEAALSGADMLLCLDFNTFSRTEQLEKACRGFKGHKVLVDHHAAPCLEEFDLAFSSVDVSSASELLYRLLLEMPAVGGDASRLPAPAAYALMTGMTTDTNNFANSVFPGTLDMASALLAAGVDREDIIDRLYRSGRPQRLAAQGDILRNRLTLIPEGAAIVFLDKGILDGYGLLEGETEGFVNLPLEIKEVRLSIFAREEQEGRIRVSLRSKRGTSARRLAAAVFHGGGHEQASGGKILIPEDIPAASSAADYIATAAARFLQQQDAAETE